MIIHFFGRSLHTIPIPAKPIVLGYKVPALVEKGYTSGFIFTSCSESFSSQNSISNYTHPTKLSPSSQVGLKLSLQLPNQDLQLTLYLDNYFSNIPLLHVLGFYSISACSTARANSAEFSNVFSLEKESNTTLGHSVRISG